jgi:hypothetical protein
MEDKEIKTGKDVSLRDIADGYTRFSIKAEDTEENTKTHEAFKEFCKIETNNDYTLGLRKLLEFYESDFKYELLYERLDEQSVALANLQGSVNELVQSPRKEEDDQESTAF